MQTQRSFLDELKHQYKSGGIAVQLIAINLLVFLAISVVMVFWRLAVGSNDLIISNYIGQVVALQSDFYGFITHPWALFTHMFSHYGFFHLFTNMLFLYFSGKIFLQFFSQKRLLYVYIVGGLFGGIFEIIAQLFPGVESHFVIGASGSVMAIMVAIAVHKPNFKVNLFGILPVPMFLLAGLFFLQDFVKIGTNDGVAHFAHLGGATLGMISVLQLSSPNNIINMAQQFGDWFRGLFKSTRKPKIKKAQTNSRLKTDEQYNEAANDRQALTDKILDKISKSGYESLTRKEKDFLFKQSGE